MMKVSAWLLLFAAFFTTTARAEDIEIADEEDGVGAGDEYDDEDYEEDMDAHEVYTSFLFPAEGADSKLPLGKEVTLLVDFSNNGQDVFNVTRIGAFLHSPHDLGYYIQNFSQKATSGVAAPGSQVSLEYTFTPDAKLEALEVWVSAFVEYNMEGTDEPFQLIFLNATMDLVDANPSFIDFATIATWLLIFGAIGGAAYSALNFAASKGLAPKRKKKAAPKRDPNVEPEWEVDTYKPKAPRRRKK